MRAPLTLLFLLTAVAGATFPEAAPAQAQHPNSQEEPAGFMEALGGAQRALAGSDHHEVRRLLRAALRFVPDHALALFYLARTEAVLGDDAAALAVLERLALQGAARDISADSAFFSLHADERFIAATEQLAANAAPLVRGDTVHVLDSADFIPEGIAHDPASSRFFAGSLNRMGIVEWQPGRASRAFVDTAAEPDLLVIGLRVDADRRRLWAATLQVDSAAPAFSRGIGGRAALTVYDLRTGARVALHRAPDDGRPHMFNDLAVTAGGDVYVTDSEEGALYRLRSGGSAVERVYGDDVNFTYPNGVALSTDGGRLFVAHIEGISRFELDEPRTAMVRMPAPPGVPTTGIDGLYTCGPGLLGVQNRMGFQQVTYFTLDASGRRITGSRALERRHPAHDAATTGAVVGDEFHYIANAQLRRLGPDWRAAPDDRAALPLILRLPLDGECGVPDHGSAGY
jgi:sugar lactone lactonase YvrE